MSITAAANILKVVDIQAAQLPNDFVTFLTNTENYEYSDACFNEHIYNATVLETIETEQEQPLNKVFKDLFNMIETLCNENEAGYFRLIFS